MKNMTLKMNLKNLLSDESGQDLIEYALLAGLIGLVAIASVTTIGTKVAAIFTSLSGQLPS
jgi:pilus assembly protein Flp/PilA